MISHFYKNIYDSFSKKTLSLLHFLLVFFLHIAKQYNSSTPAINSHAQSQNDINARDSESCSTQQPQTLEKKKKRMKRMARTVAYITSVLLLCNSILIVTSLADIVIENDAF